VKIDLGEVLCEWNQLAEAERLIREGLQDNAPWQNVMTDGFGLVALARVLQAQGDYAAALPVVEQLEARMQGIFRPREFDEEVRTRRVRLQLAGGDRRNPVLWAERVQRDPDFARDPDRYRLVLARVRLTEGDYAGVEKYSPARRPRRG
jgi:ATP/maltotriose-dependent transcriptional regulator MalT